LALAARRPHFSRKTTRAHGLALAVVDYLQLVDGPGFGAWITLRAEENQTRRKSDAWWATNDPPISGKVIAG
jgi:hypothetical protein